MVPVRRQDMKKFPGQVLDMSSTGSTVFMEPAVITKLQAELNLLQMEESNEVYRILADLSGQVAEHRQELSINMEAMVHYDFVFAKAKYSRSMDMKAVSLNRSNEIKICQGRHPLLGQMAVPLDFSIGQDYRALGDYWSQYRRENRRFEDGRLTDLDGAERSPCAGSRRQRVCHFL